MTSCTSGDFSIVTTVYNGERYLERYLSSTLALVGDSGAEIVIVDDGSNDGSHEIINRYINEAALRYVRAERLGRSKALNLGVQSSERKYVAILDVDDVSLPNRLQRLAELVNRHTDATLFATSGATIGEDVLAATSDYTSLVAAPSGAETDRIFDSSDIFNRNFLIHSAVAFRKSDWEAIGFYDEELRSCLDLDIYLRLLKNGKGAYDPAKTVIFSYNLNSFFRTRKKSDYRHDLLQVMKKARRAGGIRLGDMLTGYLRAFRYTVLS